jgi:hypothetical protein
MGAGGDDRAKKMPPKATPLWRRAFDTLERAAGSPLERGFTSSEFAMTLAAARRLRRAAARNADAVASCALHQLALPSHADIRGLRRQLAHVERELGALRRDLDSREAS